MRIFFHTIAVVLALSGQWAVALGVPILRPAGADDCAACGCCPADKEALTCCCHPAPSTPAVEPKATCCHVEPAKPKHACCVEEVEVPAPEPLRWQWLGGVLTKQCRGPLDGVAVLGVAPASPPAPLTDRLTPVVVTFARPTSEHPTTRGEPPPAPPPRVDALYTERLLSRLGDVDAIQGR